MATRVWIAQMKISPVVLARTPGVNSTVSATIAIRKDIRKRTAVN
jgi:hypothetical protein